MLIQHHPVLLVTQFEKIITIDVFDGILNFSSWIYDDFSWLRISKNDIFNGPTDAIHGKGSMLYLVKMLFHWQVRPKNWKISKNFDNFINFSIFFHDHLNACYWSNPGVVAAFTFSSDLFDLR